MHGTHGLLSASPVQLPAGVTVLVVDDDKSLRRAASMLHGTDIVGLDQEVSLVLLQTNKKKKKKKGKKEGKRRKKKKRKKEYKR